MVGLDLWFGQPRQLVLLHLLHLQLDLFTQTSNIKQHEGIFVFPNEVSALETDLLTYLNLLFQPSTFEESLVLRGIYLTGDNGFGLNDSLYASDIDEVEIKQKEGIQKLNPTGALDPLNQICFVNDLLVDKIFKETGLAQPIAKRLYSANKSLQMAKLGTASFAVIATTGMMHAYDKFSSNKDLLLPILGQMNTVLKEISSFETQQTTASRDTFNEYSKQLIQMMDEIEGASFRSIFLPASWFSSFQKNLHHSVKISYDRIILKTIYVDLILKSKELLNLRPSSQTRSNSLAQLLNPTTSTEYKFFETYVTELSNLLKHIKKFNELKESTTADDLADLVRYSLGGELPKEFYKHYRRFRGYLVDIVYDPITLENHEQKAKETAHILYTNFLYSVFASQDVFSILGRLNFIVEKYSKQNNDEAHDIAPLAQFANELSIGLQTLPDVGQTWLDSSYFDPGANTNPAIPSAFMELITKVQDNPLLGASVVEDMAQESAEAFSSFQQGLYAFNASLGTNMDLEASLNLKPGSNPPSKGLFQLNVVLSKLFSQSFMQPVTLQPFITQIPESKVFFWDTKLIQKASDMARQEDDFMKKNISSFPTLLQASLKDIILKNSQDHIITLIARAQHLSDVDDHSQNQASEEVVRAKLLGYKDVSDDFIHLLEVLNKGNIANTYLELRSMLGMLASNLLSRVESVFKTYETYGFKDNTFDWWDGDKESSFEAFSVKDKEDLKKYLDHQREVVTLWASEYAKPVLGFLTSAAMKDEKTVNQKIVNKWSRLLTQLEAYQKAKPNNSLFQLEDFILNKLTTITLKDVFDRVPLSEVQEKSGDYFLETMLRLKRALLSKAEVLKRESSIKNYVQLVELFNQSLKNKFPFVATNLSRNQGEAEPEDIKEFFLKYKEFGNSPQAILDQLHQVSGLVDEPMQFLKAMEKVKLFFDSYLTTSGQDDGPSFDFSIDFRINKARERGANHVVDWTFNLNDALTITNHDKLKNGRWTFGDPIAFTFRWAGSSDLTPTKDRGQPFMGVDDKTALFKYPGRWALLWLVRVQSAVSGDFNSMNDPTPYTLKFSVPLGAHQKAILFNRVTIMAPAKGKAPGKVLEIPAFPIRAPNLPDKVEELKEKPVLALGLMEKSEETEDEVALDTSATPDEEGDEQEEEAPKKGPE